MAFENLPGVIPELVDGGLTISAPASGPSVLVMGTAASGPSDTLISVRRSSDALQQFGRDGTLTRGMFEAKAAGAENIQLFRLGATQASVEGIGVGGSTPDPVGGIKIETIQADDDQGVSFKYAWDNTAKRLQVIRASDGTITYDNDLTNPVDFGEVVVSGTFTVGEGFDIGTIGGDPDLDYEFVCPAGGGGVNVTTDTTCVEGTDGTNLSRMAMWEKFNDAFELLANSDVDVVIPMDVYLDDYNTISQGPTGSAKLPITENGSNSYPTANKTDGLNFDSLGMVHIEEFEGQQVYWWRFADSGVMADVWPTVGLATSTTGVGGTTLVDEDFHEVNFAWDLGKFLFTVSENTSMTFGVIGVRPPDSFSLADVSRWIGKLPTITVAPDGSESIALSADNGTGLLGNKFMSGSSTFKAGTPDAGFILTDGGFVSTGSEVLDSQDNPVDLGKYLNVAAHWATLFNDFDINGLGTRVNIAAAYAGLITTLAPKSAPTNKVLPSARLNFRISPAKLDELAAKRYVMLQSKTKGVTVTAANTGSRPTGDYRFLTTFRIVKSVVKAIRDTADGFIGEAGGALERVGLETALNSALEVFQRNRDIQRFDLKVNATVNDTILGRATIELELVPAFELRQLSLIITLRAT